MTSRMSARSTSVHLGREGVDSAKREPLAVIGQPIDVPKPAQKWSIDIVTVIAPGLYAEDLVGPGSEHDSTGAMIVPGDALSGQGAPSGDSARACAFLPATGGRRRKVASLGRVSRVLRC